jgi:hypothetical protein
LPGERNPQSAAEEFALPPQGENVLDASMMAELIVTKKEIAAQLKESTGTSRARMKDPGAVVNDCRWREDMGRALDSLVPGFGGALGGGVHALSVWTPAERGIGADTAAWPQVIQGHSQDQWR